MEVNGKLWRRSDPYIPPALRQELVNELMDARRAVGAATNVRMRLAARRRVHDAKVALGERGRGWWLAGHVGGLAPRIRASLLALLRSRRRASTICPSEAARIVDGRSWRRLLPAVREVAAEMATTNQLIVMRRGARVSGDLTAGTLRYALPGGG